MAKICPVMSGPATVSGNGVTERHAEIVYAYCQENNCPWYINPYTTENRLAGSDCAVALIPQMHNGLLRV